MEEIIREDEINLVDLLIVIVKRKRLVVGITSLAAVVTAIISLTMPPVYKAETTLLPPQQGGSSSMANQLLGQLGGAAGLIGGAVGIKNTADLYIGFLKSRNIVDRIIDRFRLMELYKAKTREDARRNLINIIKVQDDKKSGIITIGAEDKDPKMAADLANALVEELKNFTKGLAVTEAAQRRLFFEEQLKDAKEGLIKAEESMKGFQEKTGAFKIDEQARAAIEGIAQLRAQIIGKEVELKVMKTYATPQNPDIQRGEEELSGLKEELKRLEAKESGNPNPSPFISTGSIPTIGTDYIRKLRDLKYNETLYELFTKQYEIAKLDESRDAAIIQVIDSAIPPEQRIKPHRSRMVVIATIAGFFFSILAAFFMEFIEKASTSAEDKGKLEILKKHAFFL